MNLKTGESEEELQVAVAEYLALAYPKVMFHSDFGSGTHLSHKQSAIQRRQNAGRRGWPDLFIAAPREKDKNGVTVRYGGLFLELKKEGTRIYKKDGTPATPHIAEQLEVLRDLELRGYKAKIVAGFSQAKREIDEYLTGGKRWNS